MSKSFYTLRPDDPKAYYLDQFGACGDGKTDDTAAIQNAIRTVYEEKGFGIVFVPEGEYLISDTILLPKGIRLIGFGANRPVFRLKDNAPGFDQPVPNDKGGSRYMLWFTGNLPKEPGAPFLDGNPGTFYGSLENIDFYVGQGNTNTIAVRSHVAQNTFIAHCDFYIESGRAGIFDVGNDGEDLGFYGGKYGIISTKCAPSWPFMLLDSVFEGQSEAAVRSYDVGFTVVRAKFKDTPTVFYVEDDNIEKIYLQDCLFENITKCAICTAEEASPANQQNALNIQCKNVPVFFESRSTGETVCADSPDYLVEEYHYGYVVSELGEESKYDILLKTAPLETAPVLAGSDIPPLPDMNEWVNIRALGAKGDGKTDDTAVFKEAIEKYRVIYLPQGVYVVTDTLALKKDTVLVGLHCYTTQLYLPDRTPAYNVFGSPKALLEIPKGGDNYVNGLGLDTGGANQLACACIWQGSETSCLRDIRFVGGHGAMSVPDEGPVGPFPIYNATGTDDGDPLRQWDSQYPSLWVKGGGGVFVNMWAASSYTSMGLQVENTSVPGKIYCFSIEHHARRESFFNNVQNWSVYAYQTEEVPAESFRAMSMELLNCKNMLLATIFTYRVSRLRSSFPYAIRINNCENINFYGVHNFSQSRYAYDNLILDMAGGQTERSWELTRLTIGKPKSRSNQISCKPCKLFEGFWFADGSCTDSKGNVYFTDAEEKRIYRIDAKTLTLSLVQELNVKPFSLICDTKDNLIIVAEYLAQRKPNTGGGPRPRFVNKLDCTAVFTIKDGELQPLPIQETAPAQANWVHAGTFHHIFNTFMECATAVPEKYYVAPDGITVIPVHPDLLRARFLTAAASREDVYCTDEFFGWTYRFTVGENGVLTNPAAFTKRSESCVLPYKDRVYVCDGQISIYSPTGEKLDQLDLPERPSTLSFGGENKDILFVTARTGIYACKLD